MQLSFSVGSTERQRKFNLFFITSSWWWWFTLCDFSWGEVRGFLPTPDRALAAKSRAASWASGLPGVNYTSTMTQCALLHWKVYSSMDDDKENLHPWGRMAHNLVDLVTFRGFPEPCKFLTYPGPCMFPSPHLTNFTHCPLAEGNILIWEVSHITKRHTDGLRNLWTNHFNKEKKQTKTWE